MSSALSKEMGMVETQLNRCKEIAQEAASLRSKADTLKVELDIKVLNLSIILSSFISLMHVTLKYFLRVCFLWIMGCS